MEVILHHVEGEGSHRLFGVLLCGEFVCCPPFVYLFNHVFISVWTQGYLFYPVDFGPVILHCVAQIVLVLAVGHLFTWPLCSLAMPHHLCFKHIFISWHHKVLLVHFRYSCPIPRINPLSRDPLLIYFWSTCSGGWLPTFLRGFSVLKVRSCTPCNLYVKLEDSSLLQKYAENLCNHLCIVC